MTRNARARCVLGIESSCDDTSVAVLVDGTELRSHLIAAQDVHKLYGGIVPELASRAHLELLPDLVPRALEDAGVAAHELTAIAVSHAPGLVGSLVVGVAFAKAYGHALGIPVIGVDHIEAHLHAASLEHGESPLPMIALIVSGGHSELIEVNGLGAYRWLGTTRDDAAGEAYDKVAKLLGLGFPGGPVIDRLARQGDPAAFDFPRPMIDRPGYDVSFSGLKTAVSLVVASLGPSPLSESRIADVCASFQAAVVDTLVARTRRALDDTRARALTAGGGVACNSELRSRLEALALERGIPFRVPSVRLCADNAAMVAYLGARLLDAGAETSPDLDAAASLEDSGRVTFSS